ncbi:MULTISPECIES: hypothetical protein [unclassified Bradyrhizobium]|uniref:hypothetical protein n=2 Tax=Bradyrhizobium TaxID=374 RepID=UPI0028EA90FB|nr:MULTISPECIES: hypothetical protein [unclassified Bradyrhizobium]
MSPPADDAYSEVMKNNKDALSHCGIGCLHPDSRRDTHGVKTSFKGLAEGKQRAAAAEEAAINGGSNQH